MSTLSDLKAKAATELSTLKADGMEYVSALEAKIAANLPTSIGTGIAGMVVGAILHWLYTKV